MDLNLSTVIIAGNAIIARMADRINGNLCMFNKINVVVNEIGFENYDKIIYIVIFAIKSY